MARAVKEWIGKTDDSIISGEAKKRVVDRQNGLCALCTRELGPSLKPEFDHEIPLGLGGKNRESNIRALCPECHKPKTASDKAAIAKAKRISKKHLSIKPRKHNWNPRKAKFNWKTGRYELSEDPRIKEDTTP
jgi:5-methylcytosine-specific restriction enzyme A